VWIISRKRLTEFWKKHSAAEAPLRSWHSVVKAAEWLSFDEVRSTFRSADQYGNCVVFNIGGNNFRLIAAIHYNTGKLFVLHVLTHREYDRGNWKSDCV